MLLIDVGTHKRYERPDTFLFSMRQIKEVTNVTFWNHQGMTEIKWKTIWNSDGHAV